MIQKSGFIPRMKPSTFRSLQVAERRVSVTATFQQIFTGHLLGQALFEHAVGILMDT